MNVNLTKPLLLHLNHSPPFAPPPLYQKERQAAFHYKIILKCLSALRKTSFHDIINCQYGKPVAYIVKFKPVHRESKLVLMQPRTLLGHTEVLILGHYLE